MLPRTDEDQRKRLAPLIKRAEGLRLDSYRDAVGIAIEQGTIGHSSDPMSAFPLAIIELDGDG
jgi:GH24 family phage-related lysozyme (muramidase)